MINDIVGVHLRALEQISESGFSLGVGFDGEEPAYMKSTYSGDWIERYLAQRYYDVDPTIEFGKAGAGCTTWQELRRHYPASESFFDDAARFGLVRGNTLAIHINGQISVMSCSGPEWNEKERRIAKAALYAIHALHYRESEHFSISDRSRDVLRLMCAGCKDKEISERLGIELVTVRQRRQTAMQALEANSTAQLVSLVIKFGLI